MNALHFVMLTLLFSFLGLVAGALCILLVDAAIDTVRDAVETVRDWFRPIPQPVSFPPEWVMDIYNGNPACWRSEGVKDIVANRSETGELLQLWINGHEIPVVKKENH